MKQEATMVMKGAGRKAAGILSARVLSHSRPISAAMDLHVRFLRKALLIVFVTFAGLVCIGSADAFETDNIGVRAGLGSDLAGGFSYSLGGNYLIESARGHSFEVGVFLLGGNYILDNTDWYSGMDNHEETEFTAFGATASYLFGYDPDETGFFFPAGLGYATIDYEWEEGAASSGIFSRPVSTEEGTTDGILLNLGIGWSFSRAFDIRAEMPVVYISAAIVPVIVTFMITAGFRF